MEASDGLAARPADDTLPQAAAAEAQLSLETPLDPEDLISLDAAQASGGRGSTQPGVPPPLSIADALAFLLD